MHLFGQSNIGKLAAPVYNIGENFHLSRGPTPRLAPHMSTPPPSKETLFVCFCSLLSRFSLSFPLSFSTIVDVRAGTCVAWGNVGPYQERVPVSVRDSLPSVPSSLTIQQLVTIAPMTIPTVISSKAYTSRGLLFASLSPPIPNILFYLRFFFSLFVFITKPPAFSQCDRPPSWTKKRIEIAWTDQDSTARSLEIGSDNRCQNTSGK